MSRLDELLMREARYETKAKRPLGEPEDATKPATKIDATKANKAGRPPINERAMTSTERSRRRRDEIRKRKSEENS